LKPDNNPKTSSNNNEISLLGKAVSALAVALWGVVPMLVLGWLVSAVGRYKEAENAIQHEPVYKLILFWQGGTNMIPPASLLLLFIMFILFLSFLARVLGYSEPEDGLSGMRTFVQRVLLPSLLSGSAFACGMVAPGTVAGLVGSFLALVLIALIAAIFYYFTETTRNADEGNSCPGAPRAGQAAIDSQAQIADRP
jgi:hypothetical protein